MLVVLRVAIGWHCAYEGICKIDPHWLSLVRGKEPKSVAESWTAEGYLRNSTGPGRHYFRNMIEDLHGEKALDAKAVEAKWQEAARLATETYRLSPEQKKALDDKLTVLAEQLTRYVSAEKTAAKIDAYKQRLATWKEHDAKDWYGGNADLQKESAELEGIRRELVGPVSRWGKEFETTMVTLLTPDQHAMPAPQKSWDKLGQLEQSNLVTKYGLTICGTLMMLGLFSRLSSLGTACFLALFYFSLPPWPGLPPIPGAEGNYLIVNKNLIEMIACLALATLPTGVWGGLDALIRGAITRPLFGVGAQEVIDRHRDPEEEED